MDTRYFNLIGEYEKALDIPEAERTMHYWAKFDTYFIKDEELFDKARLLRDEALKAIGKTRDLFEFDDRFGYRENIELEIAQALRPTTIAKQKFEVVEIFNKPVLFSNERIGMSDVASNLYRYEIRHEDEDQGNMAELKNYVLTNRMGTVICKEMFDIVKEIDGEVYTVAEGVPMTAADYNFTGEEMTIQEYIKSYSVLLNKANGMDTRYIDLVAVFENAMKIPPHERATEYFNDHDLYYIKSDKMMSKAVKLKEQMLDILDMTQEEFDKKPEFTYRSEIRKALTECLESYRNIYGCKDKRYLFESLSREELETVENILKAYGGKIDLDIPRDAYTGEIDFEGEFKLIIEDESYEEVGIEVTVLKWYESLEDTSYMIDVVQSEDCYLQDEMEQTADSMGGMSMG